MGVAKLEQLDLIGISRGALGYALAAVLFVGGISKGDGVMLFNEAFERGRVQASIHIRPTNLFEELVASYFLKGNALIRIFLQQA